MSWRTVVISGRAKLDFKLGYMTIRKEEEIKLFLDEVSILIIDSTQVSITTHLLMELIKQKTKVILCDHLHNPIGEIMGLYDHTLSTKHIREQISWEKNVKTHIWEQIVKKKIETQEYLLRKYGFSDEAILLEGYTRDIKDGDISNREGHAAKVYFNAIFGNTFKRGQDCFINAALNYGYAILLSAFNREIVASGYITQIGISHHNTFNQFNLSCDLMEPLRPFIDDHVLTLSKKDDFTKENKHEVLTILSKEFTFADSKQHLLQVITLYTKSVFRSLSTGEDIIFPSLEGQL